MDFGSLHNRYEILHIFHNVRLIMELYNVLEDQPPVATCRLDFGGLCMLIRYVAHVAQLQLAEERQLTNLVHGSPLVQWQGFFLKFSADSHIPNWVEQILEDGGLAFLSHYILKVRLVVCAGALERKRVFTLEIIPRFLRYRAVWSLNKGALRQMWRRQLGASRERLLIVEEQYIYDSKQAWVLIRVISTHILVDLPENAEVAVEAHRYLIIL